MGIIQRQALLNTLTNYIGVAIGFVNVMVLFPFFLSQEEFGLTRLVLSIIAMMAQLASFGVNRIAVKFFPLFRTAPHKNNGLLLILLVISLIGFVLLTILYYFFETPILSHYQDESSLFKTYYKWIPLATLGFLFFIAFESFLQALKKTVFTNFLRNVIIRIYWLIALILYSFDYYSFFHFMLIYMTGYFVTATLCVFELLKIKEFSLDINPVYTRKRILKPMINYGFYTLFSMTTLIMVNSVDILMIGALSPIGKLKYVGIYAIATYVVAIIFIPSNALMRISLPIVSQDWKNRNINKIDIFYKKSSVILVFLGSIIFGCILLNLDLILSFMKPEYAEAKYIIIILGASRIFDMAFGLNYTILVVTKFYRAESVLAILLLILVITTNYLLIPDYGINGAAIGTASVFFLFNTSMCIYIWLKIKIQPFSLATFKMIALGILSYLIVFYIPINFENRILIVIIKSSIFVTSYIIPVYLLKVSSDINDLINNFLAKKS